MTTNHDEQHSWECPACGAVADPRKPFNGYCQECGADFYAQGDDDHQPGEVRETGNGITLRTPDGEFFMTEDEALDIAGKLVFAARGRITRPWSNTDPSTVLSRGLRHHIDPEDN